MKLIGIIFTCVFFFFSCENIQENEKQTATNNTSIIFGSPDFIFPPLSEPVKEQTLHWGTFEDFLATIKNINGSNYQDLRNQSALLNSYADSLFKNMPDTLNTKPINSRLLVLRTRSEILFQTSHQSVLDSLNLQKSLQELNTAFANLIIHLNEKFQKDSIDFQRKEDEETELKKQKNYQDSIINLEYQDKMKKKV